MLAATGFRQQRCSRDSTHPHRSGELRYLVSSMNWLRARGPECLPGRRVVICGLTTAKSVHRILEFGGPTLQLGESILFLLPR